MKKDYETPKAEKMDFDYEDKVVASGTGSSNTASDASCLTDAASTNWWKCETRIVDVKDIPGTVCYYL